MAVPWLSTLPKAARLFFPIAESGIAKGLAANSIIEAYKTAKPGIRRTLGLEVIRRIKEVERKSDVIKYVRKKYRPDPKTIPTALTSILRNYSYKVKYVGLTDVGKVFESFVSVSSDTILTPQQALDIALEYLSDDLDEYGISSIEGVTIVGIVKSARLG